MATLIGNADNNILKGTSQNDTIQGLYQVAVKRSRLARVHGC